MHSTLEYYNLKRGFTLIKNREIATIKDLQRENLLWKTIAAQGKEKVIYDSTQRPFLNNHFVYVSRKITNIIKIVVVVYEVYSFSS